MICQRCKEQTDYASIVERQLTCEKCELRLQIQHLQSLNKRCTQELYDCIVERDKLRTEKTTLGVENVELKKENACLWVFRKMMLMDKEELRKAINKSEDGIGTLLKEAGINLTALIWEENDR